MKLGKLFLFVKRQYRCFIGDYISQGAGPLKNTTEENVVTIGRDVGKSEETSWGWRGT